MLVFKSSFVDKTVEIIYCSFIEWNVGIATLQHKILYLKAKCKNRECPNPKENS